MFLKNLQKTLQNNIRDYGMFIALFVIMAFFTVCLLYTSPSPRD